MIHIKKGTQDTLRFTLTQVLDNKREPLPLTGASVLFYAKQIGPRELTGDPNPPKTISVAATIVDAAAGIVTVYLDGTNTNQTGEYECYIKAVYAALVPPRDIFCKFPFKLVVWDL